jgi:hypothetical protein
LTTGANESSPLLLTAGSTAGTVLAATATRARGSRERRVPGAPACAAEKAPPVPTVAANTATATASLLQAIHLRRLASARRRGLALRFGVDPLIGAPRASRSRISLR